MILKDVLKTVPLTAMPTTILGIVFKSAQLLEFKPSQITPPTFAFKPVLLNPITTPPTTPGSVSTPALPPLPCTQTTLLVLVSTTAQQDQ